MTQAPIREICVLIAGRCVRALERMLPVDVTWIVCWPFAAFQAACELTFGTLTVRQFDRLPPALRTRASRFSWVAYLWREQTNVNLARLLCLWPDRLVKQRWTDRCRSDGVERLEQDLARGRPVALALLHFGPAILIVHWLRARGLPAAGVRNGPMVKRPLIWRFIDRLTASAGRPARRAVFDRAEIRAAREHLQAGGALAMTVEGRHARHLNAHADGISFDMATGILRLASATGALVIPCLISAGPRMSCTLHLGEPVPDELVVNADRHRAACDHLLRELLAVVRLHPGQCHMQLIEHLHFATSVLPAAAEAISEISS